MTRARDLADSADKDITGTLTVDGIGIGTTSPTSSSGGKLLAIETTANEHTNLVFNTANTGRNGIIEGRRTGRSGSERFAQINIQNNSDDGEIRFYTAPSGSDVSERMRIDDSGRVTTPNQPMFMADMRGNGTVTSSGVLPFSNVRLNNGGNYNTTNRRFTAPIAGKYMFQYGFLVRNAVMSSRLQVNGSDTASARTGYCDCLPNQGSIGLEVMACGSEILTLSANDYVHVHISFHAGGDIYAEDISYFNGFLIG